MERRCFACKLKYVLEKAHALLDFTDYYDLYAKYETLAKISFDYAVVEQEKISKSNALAEPGKTLAHGTR